MCKKNYHFRVSVANKRPQFSGFLDRRTMEKTREKIKMLIQCRKTGALTEEISVWLFEIQKTSPSVYDRLADLGLCEIRKSKKTIADILSVFRKTRIKSARTTKANFEHVARNILEYFKSNADLTTITPENATAFEYWLRTAPLNKRGKYPVPYAIANVNRRIKYAKQIFEYAVVLGWLEKNPFSVLKGGKSVNPEKTCYIPPEAVYRAIQLVPLRWATVIALGRFGGLRGPSEMHALKWKDICWGDKKNPAYIGIHCKKTKNHGKMYRLVPLYPIVRDLLEQLFEEAKNKKENNTIEKENNTIENENKNKDEIEIDEERIFPWMTPTRNVGNVVGQLFARFLEAHWPDPWYNLRRSFGCDLLESKTVDVFMYEEIMGHNYETGREHYQIMTRGRQRRGISAALGLYSKRAVLTFSDGISTAIDAEKMPVSMNENRTESGKEKMEECGRHKRKYRDLLPE